MAPKYFDVHSHLNFPDYKNDLKDVISRMRDENIWTITVGTDLKTSHEAVSLSERETGIFASIGIHPVDDKNIEFVREEFIDLVKHPKVVAIGECGLDYYRIDSGDVKEKRRQEKLFHKQIEFALEFDKPLMIHSRSAYDDLIDLLSDYKKHNSKLGGNVHFFSGNLSQAERLVALGFTLSFAGPITFASEYAGVLSKLPLESILSETDAPFAAPAPWRGRRNEPVYVKEAVKTIAEIRGQEESLIRSTLVNNALRTFNLENSLIAESRKL